MTNKTNTTAAILSNMTPEFAAQVLSTMTPTEAASTLAQMNGSTAPVRRTEGTGTKSLRGQKTNDGTDRNASQFIRDQNPSLSAKEVCAAAAAVGLTFNETYVYNVRAQAKKKAEENVSAEEASKADEEKKAKLRENLEKARAAKKAKAEATATPAAAAAATPAAAPVETKSNHLSVSQFIRDCDAELSANEVVEAGAKVGLTIKPTYVHNIRSAARKAAAAE